MLPLRLVLDTNILVSAALKPSSIQYTTLRIVLTKPARLYVTDEIIQEYAEVLSRPELRVRRGTQLQFLQWIRNGSHVVKPRYRLDICADPDDNIFLECADAGRADYLITGNMKHYPSFWKSTAVITARQFIDLASPHLLQ